MLTSLMCNKTSLPCSLCYRNFNLTSFSDIQPCSMFQILLYICIENQLLALPVFIINSNLQWLAWPLSDMTLLCGTLLDSKNWILSYDVWSIFYCKVTYIVWLACSINYCLLADLWLHSTMSSIMVFIRKWPCDSRNSKW